ncbi:putative harbinger transposase-derived nuclease [Abeliophyllum distichum]|uniref:Harbinger transposase-derived nuclease n=1 Tax=Abeliophyllum distichum TaxID=126358 RepID=A0ABD1QIX2_9LAMI
MLATFLLTVGQNSRYCLTRKTFGRAHSTSSRNFNKVLKAFNTISSDMMVKPGSTVPSKIRESTRLYPYFKGRDVSSYRNRHGSLSQNVLAACNFDLEFIYILSGWEGSAHDSKLLNAALVRRNGLKVPQGKYFLVDCGFANRRQFLAPFRGVRYHLQDFDGEGLVLACAGLHNFLRKECRSDEFSVEPDNEASSPLSPSLAGFEEDEDVFETQEQQKEHANEWRINIASEMWGDHERCE